MDGALFSISDVHVLVVRGSLSASSPQCGGPLSHLYYLNISGVDRAAARLTGKRREVMGTCAVRAGPGECFEHLIDNRL